MAEPGANDESLHDRVPTVQVHPPLPVNENAVVLAGSVSVRVALVAVLGPALVTVCVYVMFLVACTGTGLGEFVTERSAESATSTLVVAELFPLLGSLVVAETEAVWVMVDPAVTVEATVTTKVKVAEALMPRFVGSVHLYGAVVVHVHPEPLKELNVVFAGNVSVSTTPVAAAGPVLLTTCVYVIVPPALTGFGLAELVTLTSACVPEATETVLVAVLLLLFVSPVVVATLAVSVMRVPAGVAAAT